MVLTQVAGYAFRVTGLKIFFLLNTQLVTYSTFVIIPILQYSNTPLFHVINKNRLLKRLIVSISCRISETLWKNDATGVASFFFLCLFF